MGHASKKGGGVEADSNSPNVNKKSNFVDTMTLKDLRDSPFSRNQLLKSADDRKIRILKNELWMSQMNLTEARRLDHVA
jgi:hypothetical protein